MESSSQVLLAMTCSWADSTRLHDGQITKSLSSPFAENIPVGV
jgi:hypothetical protein